MKLNAKIASLGLAAVFAATAITPALADGYQNRQKQQTDKNNMRNLGIAGAAVAALGLLTHNSTATLLGAAGAAIGGTQYEKDRQNQSQDNNNYYYRDGRSGYNSDWNSAHRYNSQDWSNRNQNTNRRWNNDGQSANNSWNNSHDRDYDYH